MSSNKPRRDTRPAYQPDDEDIIETRSTRRDPRRRTPYAPRQASPVDDYLDEPQSRQRSVQPRRVPSRQQPQRSSRQQQSYPEPDPLDDEYYYDDQEPTQDRVIRSTGSRRRPGRGDQRGGSSRARETETYREVVYEEVEEYDYAEGDYDDRFDDGFVNEDDWYEEEAAAGGYRPRQRAARSVSRPSISVPRPTMPRVSLPRPTIPVSVREAALVQDRDALPIIGLLLLSLVGMVVVAAMRVDELQPGFATHISASGIAEDFRTAQAIWQLPLMAGALLAMNLVLAWFLSSWSAFAARFVLIASIIVQVIIWAALIRLAF